MHKYHSFLGSSIIIFLVFLTSCNYEEKVSPERISEPGAKFIEISDLPELSNYLLNQFGFKSERSSASLDLNSLNGLFGHIEIEKALEVTDSAFQKTYTFALDDNDNNPLTFTNLVIKTDGDGKFQLPFFIDYNIDSIDAIRFFENDLSMDHFTGFSSRRYISSSDNNKSSANLEHQPTTAYNQCNNTSYYVNGVRVDPETYSAYSGGGTQDEPILDEQIYTDCDEWYEDYKIYTVCPKFVSSGSQCVDYYLRVYKKRCYGENGMPIMQTSTENCNYQSLEDIGVIIPHHPVGFIMNILSLTEEETDWLEANWTFSTDLMNYILFEGQYKEDGTISSATYLASKSLIALARAGVLELDFTASYRNIINQYTSGYVNTDLFLRYLSAEITFLMLENEENPEWYTDFNNRVWNKRKLYWEASLNTFQTLLDLGGLAPVVGEVCDLVNGGIYLLRGDGLNATLSFSAAIPIAGWFSTGAKFATKGPLRWVLKSDNLIHFGSRSNLRKTLSIPKGDPRQAHHILSWGKRNHEVIQKAAKGNDPFHMNEITNGLPIDAWRNQPNHHLYDTKVEAALNEIKTALGPNMTSDQAAKALRSLAQRIRQAIIDNPSVHLNNIDF